MGRYPNITDLLFTEKTLVIIIIAFFQFPLSCQSISTTSLLEKFLYSENHNIPFNENISFYNNVEHDIPIVDELSFRTETDEFNLFQQQYQLRFKFNSNAERNAISQLSLNNQSEFKIKQDLYLLDKLEEINNDIIIWYVAFMEIKLQNEAITILEDKQTVLQKLMLHTSDIEVKKWISNKSKIRDLKMDVLRNIYRIKEVKTKYNNINEFDIQFNDWITIEQIKHLIFDYPSSNSLHPNTVLNSVNEQIAVSELEFEQAKAKKWLDFVLFQYKGNDKLSFGREFSFGANVLIPLKSSNRIKRNEAELEWIKSKSKTQLQLRKLNKNTQKLIAKLNRSFNDYDLIVAFINDQKMIETLDNYKKIKDISPLLLISIEEAILDDKRKKMEIEKEIYFNYLDLLFQSGTLIQFPLKNYLNNDYKALNFEKD